MRCSQLGIGAGIRPRLWTVPPLESDMGESVAGLRLVTTGKSSCATAQVQLAQSPVLPILQTAATDMSPGLSRSCYFRQQLPLYFLIDILRNNVE